MWVFFILVKLLPFVMTLEIHWNLQWRWCWKDWSSPDCGKGAWSRFSGYKLGFWSAAVSKYGDPPNGRCLVRHPQPLWNNSSCFFTKYFIRQVSSHLLLLPKQLPWNSFSQGSRILPPPPPVGRAIKSDETRAWRPNRICPQKSQHSDWQWRFQPFIFHR